MTNTHEVNAIFDTLNEILVHASESYATTAATLVKLEQKPEMNPCKEYVKEFNAALNKFSAKFYLSMVQMIHQDLLAELQVASAELGKALQKEAIP